MASWYHGSSRGRSSAKEPVAAHKTLPLGTNVRVTALDTGRTVDVRINDRGPFGRGRVIDVSRSAADALGMRREGCFKAFRHNNWVGLAVFAGIVAATSPYVAPWR